MKNNSTFFIGLNDLIHKYTGLRSDKKVFNSFLQITLDLRLAANLGRIEIASQFGNTALGALWQPITLGVTLFGIGVIFGSLFNMDVKNYLPYLTFGMVTWTFIVSALTEASRIFLASISQNLSYHHYILLPVQVISRNIFMFTLNLPTVAIVIITCEVEITLWGLVFTVFGMMNLFILVFASSLIFSLIGSRYRDFPNVVQNCLQILFFVTPIMWQINGVKYSEILSLNPLYLIIEFVRAPLLSPENITFFQTVVNTSLCLLFLLLCSFFWCLFSWRIPFHAK